MAGRVAPGSADEEALGHRQHSTLSPATRDRFAGLLPPNLTKLPRAVRIIGCNPHRAERVASFAHGVLQVGPETVRSERFLGNSVEPDGTSVIHLGIERQRMISERETVSRRILLIGSGDEGHHGARANLLCRTRIDGHVVRAPRWRLDDRVERALELVQEPLACDASGNDSFPVLPVHRHARLDNAIARRIARDRFVHLLDDVAACSKLAEIVAPPLR